MYELQINNLLLVITPNRRSFAPCAVGSNTGETEGVDDADPRNDAKTSKEDGNEVVSFHILRESFFLSDIFIEGL